MIRKHRHPGPLVRYHTKRNNIRYRKRPMHVQTLVFPKKKYNREKALEWAKEHGFQHYTSREEDDSIRVRQFPPSDVKRYGGTFPIGKDVKGVYAEVDKDKYKDMPFQHLRKKFNISKYGDDDKDKVPNYKDCRPWDKKRHSIYLGEPDETMATYTTPISAPEDIFISVWPEAETEDIEKVADIITHEELHNILAKHIGYGASVGLDSLVAPDLYDIHTGKLINPKTAGKIFTSTDATIDAIEDEVGGIIEESRLEKMRELMEEKRLAYQKSKIKTAGLEPEWGEPIVIDAEEID